MNSTKATLCALALCSLSLALSQASHAADDFKGSWTLMPSKETGKVRFGLIHLRDGGNSHHESDWPTSTFQGLDLNARGKRDVQFNITRDAGQLRCEGFLNDGEGAGIFHFTPDTKFVQALGALGFTGIDAEKQFAMAVHDVTVDFAKEMMGQNLSGLHSDQLIAFRIFAVTPQFIRELRAEGLSATTSDRLVAFRIHGVTPAKIRETRKSGLKPSEDQLIAMQIHGVTPEFIADLKLRGMHNLTIDQLVSLRIHGID